VEARLPIRESRSKIAACRPPGTRWLNHTRRLQLFPNPSLIFIAKGNENAFLPLARISFSSSPAASRRLRSRSARSVSWTGRSRRKQCLILNAIHPVRRGRPPAADRNRACPAIGPTFGEEPFSRPQPRRLPVSRCGSGPSLASSRLERPRNSKTSPLFFFPTPASISRKCIFPKS